MRKLILLLFSILLPVLAQDIQLRERGPYLTLGRNLLWGTPGIGGVHNTWVFTPLNPEQGICVFITNNHPTDSKMFNLQVWQTGDIEVPQYSGYEHKFRPDVVQGSYSPIGPRSTTTAYVHTSAAAKVAIRFSGSTTGGTADLYVVQTTAGGCGPVSAGSVLIQGADSVGNLPAGNPVVIGGIDSSTGTVGYINRTGNALNVTGTVTSNISGTVNTNVVSGSVDATITNTVVTARKTSCGTTPWLQQLTGVPTSLTTLRSGNTCLESIYLANSTGSDITVTISTSGGLYVMNQVVVPANGIVFLANLGILVPGDIRWQASASGLYGALYGFY